MKTTKRIFKYISGNGTYQAGIVATTTEEVVVFIEGLGFKCNERTTENIGKVFGELEHNAFNYYFMNGCYQTANLKPTGISTGYITFAPTECNTIEEYWEEKNAREARYNELCKEIREAALPVCKRLGGDTKQNVAIMTSFEAITPSISLWIEWDGMWNRALNRWDYMNDRVRHINMDTLMTENGMNIFDELKTLK